MGTDDGLVRIVGFSSLGGAAGATGAGATADAAGRAEMLGAGCGGVANVPLGNCDAGLVDIGNAVDEIRGRGRKVGWVTIDVRRDAGGEMVVLDVAEVAEEEVVAVSPPPQLSICSFLVSPDSANCFFVGSTDVVRVGSATSLGSCCSSTR